MGIEDYDSNEQISELETSQEQVPADIDFIVEDERGILEKDGNAEGQRDRIFEEIQKGDEQEFIADQESVGEVNTTLEEIRKIPIVGFGIKKEKQSFIKKWSKIGTLALATLFAGKGAHNTYDAMNELSTTDAVTGSVVERAPAPTDQYEQLNEMGIDVERLRELGYEVRMAVESINGKYVIHVCDHHDRPEFSGDETATVITHQKKQEQLLKMLKDGDSPMPVYKEGVTDIGKLTVDSINFLKRDLEKISASETGFQELLSLHEHQSDVHFSDTVKAMSGYAFAQKFDLLKQAMGEQGVDPTTLEGFADAQELFDDYDTDTMYRHGAVYKLMTENEVEIMSGEDGEAFKGRTQAMRELKSPAQDAGLAEVMLRGGEIADELEEKRDQFIEANEHAETMTLRKVSEKAGRRAVLVFGQAHDLENNVRDQNGPGLIEIWQAQ